MEEQAERFVYSDWLYIPKGVLYEPSIKAALTFTKKGYKADSRINGWKETETHLLVPRDFYKRKHFIDKGFTVVEEIPEFPTTSLRENIELDKLSEGACFQQESFEAMRKAGSGVLNLGCGKGKTVIALKYICSLAQPAIVVVETKDLFEQWIEAIKEFIDVSPMGFDIGKVQGKPEGWVWKRPIVIAMIQSLAKYEDSIPQGMREHFGAVIYDEVHHLSSRFFVKTAPLFYGKRVGLTATPRREDGLENLYYAHIGRPFYKDIQQPLTPRVAFYTYDLPVDWNDLRVLKEICDVNGELSFTKLWGFVGKQGIFQDKTVDLLVRMLSDQRKILVLSHRVETLTMLNERLNSLAPDSAGLVIGAVPADERRKRLKTKRVVLGTMQLAKEGLDEKPLDTLLILEPFKAEGVLQQAAGRILRPYPGKKDPLVGIMRLNFQPSYALAASLKRHLKKWPTKVEIKTIAI